MPKKTTDKASSRSKPSTASKSKKSQNKKTKKPQDKKTAAKKIVDKEGRKIYPPGKSKQVPYDLVYVADSGLHGKGMFALKAIKADITLGLLEGNPTKKDGTYVLWLSETKGLEVTNDFRFINHSDKPNCALTDKDVITLRKIKPYEELTHNYDEEEEANLEFGF